MHARIDREHSEQILCLQHIERIDRALVGERDLRLPGRRGGHRTRAVEHDQHRHRRRFLAVLVLHPHRQHLFNRCFIIAAHAEAVVAAEHHKSAAEILHP